MAPAIPDGAHTYTWCEHSESIKLCTASVIALYFAVLTFVIKQQWFRDEWQRFPDIWCQHSPFIKKYSRFSNNNNNAGCTRSTGVPGFYRLITPRLPQKLGSLVSRCNGSILLSTCVAAFHKQQTYKLDYLRCGDVQTLIIQHINVYNFIFI